MRVAAVLRDRRLDAEALAMTISSLPAETPLPGLDTYAAVFVNLRDAVQICDPYGRIVDVNPAAERMFGYPLEDVRGTLPGGIRDAAGASARLADVRRHLSEHAEWSADVPFQRGDGEPRVGRATWTAL